MTKEEVERELGGLEGWSGDETLIEKAFTFDSFREAIAFVNRISDIAEAQNHHPDIDIRYNKVVLKLTSHDAGGVTKRDLRLARTISET
jgi:4a-hydroxytetrahydrobiopterin dehydratase